MGSSSNPHGKPTKLTESTNGTPGTWNILYEYYSRSVEENFEPALAQQLMNNDLLDDPFFGDMPTVAETNGALGALPGSEATSGLLNQFGPLIPPPASGAVPINSTSDTASVSGTAELGEQEKRKAGDEGEEDWLIQF